MPTTMTGSSTSTTPLPDAADATDVAVVGGGPAGLLLAAALVDQGLSVVVVTPQPECLWTENHASWLEELDAAGLGGFLSPMWKDVVVVDSRGVQFDLFANHTDGSSGYGMVNKETLQPHLHAKIRSNGSIVDDKVVGIDAGQHNTPSTLFLQSGKTLRALFVVDAAGGKARLSELRRTATTIDDDNIDNDNIDNDNVAAQQDTSAEGPEAALFQIALGVTIDVADESHHQPAASPPMVLMDWRQVGPSSIESGGSTSTMEPSFVYVMPMGGRRYFVEETILIGAARTPEDLRPRLDARIASLFGRVSVVTDAAGTPREEHCVIPMNARAPIPTTFGTFGAAAGAIHPATGYSIGWSARHAAPAAKTIAAGLNDDKSPEEIAAALWLTLWSKDADRVHRLLRAGAEVLTGLSADDVSDFFGAFFAQPQERWMAFMTRTSSGESQTANAVLAAMWGTFVRVPFGLKAKMMRLGLGPLARAAIPSRR